MTDLTSIPYFDGHNDVLSRLQKPGGCDPAIGDPVERDPVAAFLQGNDQGHLDLPRMRRGGFVGGFFACFVASPEQPGSTFDDMRGASYDLPLPEPIDRQLALDQVLQQFALLTRIERQSQGRVVLCRDAAQLRVALAQEQLAAILHLEGAEAIDTELHTLDVLHAAGLRSLGPVWSRPNAFGHGVPFRFPGSPDTGPGLTAAGKALVQRCNELKVLIDLSHLNARGFQDVATLSHAPLVATHSNAHALSANARNLTNEQLAAIRDSDGMVGVNFATAFVRADGQMDSQTSLAELVQHVSYLIDRLGESRVGFGSDFDGALIPTAIGDVTGLDALREALHAAGFDTPLIHRLCHRNWLALLERTWGS